MLIGEDKIEHFLVGGVWSLIVSYHFDSPEMGILGAVALGLGKELFDSRPGGTGFSVADLIATVMGGVIATLVLLVE